MSGSPYTFPAALSKVETLKLIENVKFYHSFGFRNDVSVVGDYDLGADIQHYPFPARMDGMRVLDIGPASGWFSFYFEQLGADVTVVETRGYGDFDRYGAHQYTGAAGAPPDRMTSDGPVWYGPVSQSFWAAHDIIGSKVKYINGRIYEIGPELFPEPFDFVFIGALLLHLRDPIGALRAARSVCRGRLVATTYTWEEHDENPTPLQIMPWTQIDDISWFLPNKAALRHWTQAAGFRDVNVESTIPYSQGRPVYNDAGVEMNQSRRLRVIDACV